MGRRARRWFYLITLLCPAAGRPVARHPSPSYLLPPSLERGALRDVPRPCLHPPLLARFPNIAISVCRSFCPSVCSYICFCVYSYTRFLFVLMWIYTVPHCVSLPRFIYYWTPSRGHREIFQFVVNLSACSFTSPSLNLVCVCVYDSFLASVLQLLSTFAVYRFVVSGRLLISGFSNCPRTVLPRILVIEAKYLTGTEARSSVRLLSTPFYSNKVERLRGKSRNFCNNLLTLSFAPCVFFLTVIRFRYLNDFAVNPLVSSSRQKLFK